MFYACNVAHFSLIKVFKFSLQTVFNFSSSPQSPHNAASLVSQLKLLLPSLNSVLHWNLCSLQNILMTFVTGRTLKYIFTFQDAQKMNQKTLTDCPSVDILLRFLHLKIWKSKFSFESRVTIFILRPELFSWHQTKWIVTAIWAGGGSSATEVIPGHIYKVPEVVR